MKTRMATRNSAKSVGMAKTREIFKNYNALKRARAAFRRKLYKM
jgi:hypothetical protein